MKKEKERNRYHQRLYWKIVAGVAAIGLFSLAGAVLLIKGISYTFSFGCLVVILLITVWIIRLIQGANRRLFLFFNALEHGDTSQHFPLLPDDPFLRELSARMNRISALFAESRAEIEEKQLYYESILRVLTHEIRNSVTPIHSLSADLLQHAGHDDAEQLKEGLSVIHSQVCSLTHFLDSYHRLTHLPDPERRPVEVRELLLKLQRLLAAERGSDRIHYRLPESLTLQADPNLLVLALLNLIRNALQATEGQAGGEIVVEATGDSSHPSITVTDNGPGIAPDRLSVIFTPFFTTKTGGSGIGLSISKRIMHVHGGEIRVSSVPYVRTSFALVF